MDDIGAVCELVSAFGTECEALCLDLYIVDIDSPETGDSLITVDDAHIAEFCE